MSGSYFGSLGWSDKTLCHIILRRLEKGLWATTRFGHRGLEQLNVWAAPPHPPSMSRLYPTLVVSVA